MAAKDLILFWDDRNHITSGVGAMTPDGTAAGAHADHVREADFSRYWSPLGVGGDHWIRVDGQTRTWLGTVGQTAAFCIAYDARGSNQDIIRLQYDSTDNSAFPVPTNAASFTLDKSRVSCDYAAIVLPDNDSVGTNPPRYWRLFMDDADRSGGNVMPKIYCWGAFMRTGYTVVSADYVSDAQGIHEYQDFYRISVGRTVGDVAFTAKYGAPGTIVSYTFGPGTEALWTKIRTSFRNNDGPHRAMFAQLTGPLNTPIDGFYMVRLRNMIAASRDYGENVGFRIEFETLAWL